MRTRSNIIHWVLYDFANSLVSIVFFLYFSQWAVIDRGISDLNFNLTFTISALLLLISVPSTGILLDKHWRRITGLRITTTFAAIFYGTCAIMAINNNNTGAIIFFTLGLYSYLLSFTFYTPLINDISTKENIGKISGWGIFANYLGQIAGLLLVLPISKGTISLFGGSARAETLLPAVIAFFILSLPMLIFFKEPKKNKPTNKEGFLEHMKNTIFETKKLLAIKSVGLFLLAYFLFNDAILTAVNNFGIFLEQVWHVSDTTKTFMLLGIMITSAIGALISGRIADKYGHKKTLMYVLIIWAVVFPFIGLIQSFNWFIVACVIMGLAFGANWTVSRSVMSYISRDGKHNLAFGYFGLAERASSLLGPIVWGLVVGGLINLGGTRYRIAISALTIFIILGLIALRKVRSDKEKLF
ncbi:MAG: MFS transporter [Nanoarchaeota archaeon]